MIIQVRGTMGSGKSTVVSSVMDAMGCWNGFVPKGCRRPTYSFSESSNVAVVGHYETVCGGCDNLGSMREVFYLTCDLTAFDFARPVLQEGIMLSVDTRWTMEYAQVEREPRILFLTTPSKVCVERVVARRESQGKATDVDAFRGYKSNGKPLPTIRERIAARVIEIESARLRLLQAGVRCHRVSSTQAVDVILRWVHEVKVC